MEPTRKDPTVHCPRLGKARPAEEHVACPYCYGRVAEVKAGDRTSFCDFKPGIDPVSFGFAPELGRFQRG